MWDLSDVGQSGAVERGVKYVDMVWTS
jgi:hypothetical protein